MTRRAALPDDSLPHWRERLEVRALFVSSKQPTAPGATLARQLARTERSDYCREIVETVRRDDLTVKAREPSNDSGKGGHAEQVVDYFLLLTIPSATPQVRRALSSAKSALSCRSSQSRSTDGTFSGHIEDSRFNCVDQPVAIDALLLLSFF